MLLRSTEPAKRHREKKLSSAHEKPSRAVVRTRWFLV